MIRFARQPRVLVVLDSMFGSDRLIRCLESHDVDVSVTVAPKLILERVEDEQPDLVVIDLARSDLNALLLLNRLRLHDATHCLPIIVAIDPAGRPPIDLCQLRAEGCAFLCRPYDSDDLLGLIDDMLAPASAGQEPANWLPAMRGGGQSLSPGAWSVTNRAYT